MAKWILLSTCLQMWTCVKACQGSRGTAPLILIIVARCRWVAKSYSCSKNPGTWWVDGSGVPEPIWIFWEEKNLWPVSRINLHCPGNALDTIPELVFRFQVYADDKAVLSHIKYQTVYCCLYWSDSLSCFSRKIIVLYWQNCLKHLLLCHRVTIIRFQLTIHTITVTKQLWCVSVWRLTTQQLLQLLLCVPNTVLPHTFSHPVQAHAWS